MDAESYLTERLNPQLEWLGRSSRSNKAAYRRYRLLGIALGSLITILSPYAGKEGPLRDWLPPLLQIAGAGVALAGSLLALDRHQENWLRYRLLKESLEREKWLYLTGSTDAYSGPEAFHQFVRVTEAIMAEERASWSRQVSDQRDDQAAKTPSSEDAKN